MNHDFLDKPPVELPDEMVVPDSIEPYRGFKALNMEADGTLWSPSEQGVQWPVKQKLEATCTRGLSVWGWVPIEGEPRNLDATIEAAKRSVGAVTSVSSSIRWPSGPHRAPKPNNPLPAGWNWSWEPLTHEAPAQDCTCGIYVVKDPGSCLTYLRSPDGIIVEVTLWGRTVPAHQGARGQFAYPTKILSPAAILDEVRASAALYEIPIVVLDEAEPEDVYPELRVTKRARRLRGK